ncbi:MAG: hypothetical protein ACI4JB_10535 [Porcipelethomonas sp.]
MNTYKIAGKVVEIDSVYDEIHRLCSKYQYPGDPDFSVKTEQKDIDFERKKSASEDIKEGKAVRVFPDSYLETLAVYRKIADIMLDHDILLFHGSVVAVDGEGYLFTAKSGTGKSTHTKLWREYFGSRAVMINDDKPLLQITPEGVIVYGTPWDGKHRLSTNTSVPLKGICILTRAEENHIEDITVPDAYPMLLQQTNRPADPLKMKKTLQLIDSLGERVPLYRLGCNMDIQAAQIAYDKMKGQKNYEA